MTSSPARRLIVAALAALVLAGCDPGGADPVAVPRPSPPVLPPLVMSREVRFVFAPEEKTQPGHYTTMVIDQQQPPGEVEMAEAELIRIPGQSKIPKDDGGLVGDDVRFITLAGTKVRVDQSEYDTGGYERQLQWVLGSTRYLLYCGPFFAEDNSVFGPSMDDLRWIAERVIRKGSARTR